MPSTDPVSSPDRIALLVLGMHRSGTSALSGTLSKIGYGLPVTLAPADHNNRNGYFESKALWAVNDELLAEVNSGWDDWTAIDMGALPEGLYQRSLDRALALIDSEYGHHEGPVLLKDPRMCRTMPLWIEALSQAGYHLHVVHTHRHPAEVAASLHRRDGYALEYGLLMWLRHVLEAERATRDLPRGFTNFNQLMQDWQGTLDGLHQSLNLPAPILDDATTADVEEFLNAKLRHFDTPPAPLAAWWQDSFDILERWSQSGENPDDHTRLNEISAALDAEMPPETALLRAGQRAAIESNKLLAELEDLRPKVETQDADLARKDSELAAQSARIKDAEAQITAKDEELRQLHLTVGARDRAIEEMSADLTHLRDAVAQKEERLAEFLSVIEERGAALDQRASDIEWFRTELETREAETIALQSDIMDREEALQRLEHEIAALADHAALSEDARKALLESSSWRLTAPLRSVVGRLRGNS